MLSKEEIENMKIGLWNIRVENLRAMQCSLADTSDKIEWQKNFDAIDNALKHIKQLESREQKLIEKLEEESKQLEHDILTMSIDTGNNYSLKLINEAKGMKKQNDRILEILKKE